MYATSPASPGPTSAAPVLLAPDRFFWREERLRIAALTCAAIAGLVAAGILLGWYAGAPGLVRLAPRVSAVQFNTALSFLLASGALIALVTRRRRVGLVLSLVVLIIAGVTLGEHLTGASAGVDEMLWHLGARRDVMTALIKLGQGTPARMAPNSAVALTLLALALVTVALRRMTQVRLAIASLGALATTTTGFVALSGYLLDMPTAYRWGNAARMAPQSAVLFILLGLGVLCGAVLSARRAGLNTRRVTPGLAATTVAIAALLMWQALAEHDRRDLEIAVRHQATAAASAVSRKMSRHATIVDRLILQRAHPGGDSTAELSLAASQVLQDFPDITAITWLDSAGRVLWRMAELAGAADAIGTRFATTPLRTALLRHARTRGRATVSFPLAGERSEPYVFIATPTSRTGETASGYLVIELVPERLLGEVLPDEFRQLYAYALEDTGVRLAGDVLGDASTHTNGAAAAPIDVLGRRWTLDVVPSPVTLREFSSALPTTFLLAALACALFAGWIVRAAQLAAEQSATLERTVADLAAENEARREAEVLRDDHADMLQVQAVELGLQYAELQTTATALAEQRDELGRAQEFSAALVRSTVDAVAACDRGGRVHAWNPAMAALTGRAQGNVSDALVGSLLPFLAPGEEVRLLEEALQGRANTVHAQRARHQLLGTEVSLDLTVTPMCSADGTVVGGLLVARDVTEQRRVAEVILASKEAAEQSNRAKSDFLARMSHELRTPLNAVIGFTNVIRRNADNRLGKADITYLDRIGANGKHLLALINTVLDLSRIESGHETVELAITPLSTLVRETIAELDVRASDAGLQIHIATPWGATATTDEVKLKQVLINLVGNAIKFTPRDGQVFVRVEADPFTGVASRIDVEDTGIGIHPERQRAIFEAFEQADAQISPTYGGTGLGLSISRKLCDLMGHDLVVESEPGKGSKFSILFPVARAIAAA